jgi:hypothetical protein
MTAATLARRLCEVLGRGSDPAIFCLLSRSSFETLLLFEQEQDDTPRLGRRSQ